MCHLVHVPSSLKPLKCWLSLRMTLPFGCVSVCHLPEQPGSVPCPSQATVPGAACAQPCGPVTHQFFLLLVLQPGPVPPFTSVCRRAPSSWVTCTSALCLPPNTTPSQWIKNCLRTSGSTLTDGILWGRKWIITGMLWGRDQCQWEDKGRAAKQQSGVRAERPYGLSCHCKLLTVATRIIKTPNKTKFL